MKPIIMSQRNPLSVAYPWNGFKKRRVAVGGNRFLKRQLAFGPDCLISVLGVKCCLGPWPRLECLTLAEETCIFYFMDRSMTTNDMLHLPALALPGDLCSLMNKVCNDH